MTPSDGFAEQSIARRGGAVTDGEVRIREPHVAAHHVERGVAEDALQAERVSAIHRYERAKVWRSVWGLQRPGMPARTLSRFNTC